MKMTLEGVLWKDYIIVLLWACLLYSGFSLRDWLVGGGGGGGPKAIVEEQ